MGEKIDSNDNMQNSIEISSVLDDITNYIIENSNSIVEANKKDIENYKKQIKVKELLEIVENYRNSNFQNYNSDNDKKAIIYYGEPYLTLNLCIQAILSHTTIYMCYSEFMENVNNAIIEIINKATKKHKMDSFINKCNKIYSLKEKIDINSFLEKEEIEDISVIGDSTIYQLLKPKYNVMFFPYNNITLYSNDDKFEKLKEAIFTFANENSYEVEIVYENNIEEFANYVNQNKLSNIAVLLTENEDDIQKVKSIIIDKELFINENPFKNEFQTVCNYLS